MEYSQMWIWKILLCFLISNTSSQRVVNVWQNEVPSDSNIFNQNIQYRPNIILILADDMGWGDMGANWAPTRDTPNLDALAKGGLRFTDFHSGASVCAPSRAALLTGRLGLRTGVIRNFGEEARGGLPSNETTLAEVLRGVGYRTAMMGKWHLGVRPGHHPLDKGFDRYLGVPYSVDMGCTDSPAADLPPRAACPREAECRAPRSCGDQLALPLIRNRAIDHQPVNLTTLSERYVRFGEDFILDRAAIGHLSRPPFFLYAAPAHVHVPLTTGERFANASGRGQFSDSLQELDWMVGRLWRAARAAARAAERKGAPRRDTLIWFLSDNGPWEVKCQLAGTAGPFEGAWQRAADGGGGGSASKMTVWEGGHRAPSIVHWPSRVPGGLVSAALTSALDVLPTLAAVARAPLPLRRAFDGRDIGAVLRSPDGAASVRQVLFHPNSGSAGTPGDVGAVRVGDLKVVYYAGGAPACDGGEGTAEALEPPLVFDLAADPAEAQPLEGARADGARREADAALRELLASVRADNTSRADYVQVRADRPCCFVASAICRCPWD